MKIQYQPLTIEEIQIARHKRLQDKKQPNFRTQNRVPFIQLDPYDATNTLIEIEHASQNTSAVDNPQQNNKGTTTQPTVNSQNVLQIYERGPPIIDPVSLLHNLRETYLSKHNTHDLQQLIEQTVEDIFDNHEHYQELVEISELYQQLPEQFHDNFDPDPDVFNFCEQVLGEITQQHNATYTTTEQQSNNNESNKNHKAPQLIPNDVTTNTLRQEHHHITTDKHSITVKFGHKILNMFSAIFNKPLIIIAFFFGKA
jgi:hypothetical protein